MSASPLHSREAVPLRSSALVALLVFATAAPALAAAVPTVAQAASSAEREGTSRAWVVALGADGALGSASRYAAPGATHTGLFGVVSTPSGFAAVGGATFGGVTRPLLVTGGAPGTSLRGRSFAAL